MSGRLVVANLHAEMEWRRDAPSARALRYASAVGSLLRVLAVKGDRVWTPLPLEREALRAHALGGRELADPWAEVEFVSGPLETQAPAREVVAFGETPAVQTLRRRCGLAAGVDPEVARRVNHRRFFLDLARELGLAHEGAAFVTGMEDLERSVRGASGSFVAKEPLSAAGRGKVVFDRAALEQDMALRARLERLLRRDGLLLEPWVERTFDFGIAAEVDAEGGTRVYGLHEQLVDAQGGFEGIRAGAGGTTPRLAPDAPRLHALAEAVGARLHAEGYFGPFGIDGYGVREQDGGRLHPLGEVNARLTMGRVAHALRGALASTAASDLARGFRLSILPAAAPPPERGIRLVAATGEDAPQCCLMLIPGSDGHDLALAEQIR